MEIYPEEYTRGFAGTTNMTESTRVCSFGCRGGSVMVVQTTEEPVNATVKRTGTVQGTVADVIVAQLGAWGIKTLYGVCGDAIFELLNAIAGQDAIEFFPTVHEFSAACMAATEARLTGRPAVCTATSGPGVVNLLNGLAEAYRDRVPLLAITGDVQSQTLGLNVKQGINQQLLMAAVTGYSAMIREPSETLPILQEAARVAVEMQTVAHISVPEDIFKKPAAGAQLLPLPTAAKPAAPTEQAIQPVITMLTSFTRPLILAGRETREVAGETAKLAEALVAGIILAQGAKGIIPGVHPQVVGGLGEAFIPAPLSLADGLLIIGTAPYEMKFLPANLPVIQITARPEYLIDAPKPPTAGLAGDVRSILQELTGSLTGYRPATEWRSKLATAHHEWLRQVEDDGRERSIPLSPRRVMAELNRAIAPDAVVALDTGEFMHWFDRSFTGHRQYLILSDYWRCMGSALPAAIAAKRLYPGKQSVVLAGDGSFVMSMYELVTAVKHNLPVKIILFNNGLYALEKHKMTAEGLQPVGVELNNPDFVSFAQSCGAAGYRIEEPAQLARLLPEALVSDQPALIEVKVSAPEPPFIQAGGRKLALGS